MSALGRYRNFRPWRVAVVAAVLVLVALFGPRLTVQQYLGAFGVLAIAAGLTALVAKRRSGE